MDRRVYFCFHYEDVASFRVNVVRSHNVTKDTNGGYFDASIWEEAKRRGDVAIKKMIDDALENTTVTVPLIGSETAARRWVQYEIFRSIQRGNRIVGIHINSIKDKNSIIKATGTNPFATLALYFDQAGTKITPAFWADGKWIQSTDVQPWNCDPKPQADRGKVIVLSTWYRTYDWVNDGGFTNFANWVEPSTRS